MSSRKDNSEFPFTKTLTEVAAEDPVVLGDDEGIYISKEEMQDLGEFLTSVQQYILSHEARIEAIEEFIGELVKGQPEGNVNISALPVDNESTDDTP